MNRAKSVGMLMNSQYYSQGYKQGASDVIDKIRAEIEETKDKIFCTDGERQGLDVVLGIIDKYRNEVGS